MAAVYETLVAAAAALSGAKITMAEIGRGSEPEPEFTMTAKSGRTYSIEAKRRQSWRHAPDYASDDFIRELGLWIRNKIHNAPRKHLVNPIYFFELNIAVEWPEEGWKRIYDEIERTIAAASENLTVSGEPIAPAYVVVTNHAAFDETSKSTGRQHMLFGCAMTDFPPSGIELEELFAAYDNHHDVILIVEALQIASTVPTTFDGTPPELAPHSDEAGYGLKVGRKIVYPTKDNKESVTASDGRMLWSYYQSTSRPLTRDYGTPGFTTASSSAGAGGKAAVFICVTTVRFNAQGRVEATDFEGDHCL